MFWRGFPTKPSTGSRGSDPNANHRPGVPCSSPFFSAVLGHFFGQTRRKKPFKRVCGLLSGIWGQSLVRKPETRNPQSKGPSWWAPAPVLHPHARSFITCPDSLGGAQNFQPGAPPPELSATLLKKDRSRYGGWTKSCQKMVSTTVPKWCEMDFVHPQYGPPPCCEEHRLVGKWLARPPFWVLPICSWEGLALHQLICNVDPISIKPSLFIGGCPWVKCVE